MKIDNIPFLNKDYNLTPYPIISKLNKSSAPFIDIFVKESFLNVFISFYDLNKKDIYIDYINNFLVLKLSFSQPFSNEIINLKRIFYYKNLDFYNYNSKKVKNIVFLKIPFKT